MDLLFLGGNFSKDKEDEIKKCSRSIVQYAANRFQWDLIEGFSKNSEIIMSIVSAPFVGTFPRDYSEFFIREYKEQIYSNIDVKYVSFWNFWGIRNIFRKRSLKKEIKEFIKLSSNNKVIFIYSPHTPFLQAAVYAKKKDPSIKLCLIVPDLPEYMNLNEKISLIYKIFKKFDIKIFKQNVKKIDSFVLITEKMKDVLKVGTRDYIVIEGIANITDSTFQLEKQKNKIENTLEKIVYTGSLNKKFGIIELVEAFSKIKRNDIQLILCGRGDAEKDIEKFIFEDSRIKYLGQVTNKESLELQKEASVLINPRPNIEEYTKYSFPYKTMEYLLSGNPVICFKLDGIPKDYDDYLFYIEENSVESIKDKIEKVLNISKQERIVFGEKAKEYVLKNKNSKVSAEKIFKLLSK